MPRRVIANKKRIGEAMMKVKTEMYMYVCVCVE